MYQEAITRYLRDISRPRIALKAVLFDMDGVLFDSMPWHSLAWHRIMERRGLHLSREEAYLHEGRTGAATINIVYRRQLGREASAEEIEEIYAEKSAEFNRFPEAQAMPGAKELLLAVRGAGLTPVLVTGSGQRSLLSRLEESFPGMFDTEHMVTAFDVKMGKPHPEPYLMGMRKAGVNPHEAIVVENAPLGVEAGRAAGLFTVAVNTGPIEAEVLREAGANLVFPSMPAFRDAWSELSEALRKVEI